MLGRGRRGIERIGLRSGFAGRGRASCCAPIPASPARPDGLVRATPRRLRVRLARNARRSRNRGRADPGRGGGRSEGQPARRFMTPWSTREAGAGAARHRQAEWTGARHPRFIVTSLKPRGDGPPSLRGGLLRQGEIENRIKEPGRSVRGPDLTATMRANQLGSGSPQCLRADVRAPPYRLRTRSSPTRPAADPSSSSRSAPSSHLVRGSSSHGVGFPWQPNGRSPTPDCATPPPERGPSTTRTRETLAEADPPLRGRTARTPPRHDQTHSLQPRNLAPVRMRLGSLVSEYAQAMSDGTPERM